MAERPEDLNLPTAVITRIIKDALPDNVNVSKDARLAISKAASVFVLYATSCANNFAMAHKRKTISGPDVIEAVTEMEFEQFVVPLRKSLETFRKEQKGKKEAAEQRKKEKEQNTSKDDEEDMEAEAEAEPEAEAEAGEDAADTNEADGDIVEITDDDDEVAEDA